MFQRSASEPGFTLNKYVHLLDEDFGEPLSLPQPSSDDHVASTQVASLAAPIG